MLSFYSPHLKFQKKWRLRDPCLQDGTWSSILELINSKLLKLIVLNKSSKNLFTLYRDHRLQSVMQSCVRTVTKQLLKGTVPNNTPFLNSSSNLSLCFSYFINHYTKTTSWEDPRDRYQQIGKPTAKVSYY
jgi:hypothetical protein